MLNTTNRPSKLLCPHGKPFQVRLKLVPKQETCPRREHLRGARNGQAPALLANISQGSKGLPGTKKTGLFCLFFAENFIMDDLELFDELQAKSLLHCMRRHFRNKFGIQK
jgi:hypothetical protein